MSFGMLDWVAEALQEDEEVIVPLKKIWGRRYGRAGEIPFNEFTEAVLKDERFEQVYCLDYDAGFEVFGCISGPRVRLRSRPITPHSVLRVVRKHNERIVRVLLHALETLREGQGARSDDDLGEAIEILEQLRPALKRWTRVPVIDKKDLDRTG